MMHGTRLNLTDALALALICAASIIGINQYTYGLYNHFITIPFIKSIIDPSLYPHDFLIAEKKYFYTYFNSGCALLVKTLGIPLPVLFFALYCLSLYATLVAFFKIALTLYPKKEVAYFSVIFLIFSFTTLAGMRTVESLFLERTFVMPLLLFAFYCFLRKKVVWAYALSGIAFLFHPLSAVYALACLFTCSVFSIKEIGWKNLIVSLMVLGVLVSPVFYLKALNPAPSLGLIRVDPEWLELLRLRSAHHLFPTCWSPLLLTQSALFIVGFGLCRLYQPTAWHHKTVILTSAAIFSMCVAGTLFTELLPVAIVIQFQLFRSFVLLIFFAIIYYSNFFFEESKTKGNVLQKLFIFICFVAAFHSGNFPKYASFLLIALAVFPGFALVTRFAGNFRSFYMHALLLLLLGLGAAGGLLRGGFTIGNKQDDTWLAAQEWAKANTPRDALFIVPPHMEGFRVESERTIYGDWKDGTQMFFNPEFGKEWIRRMKKLGYSGDDTKLNENYMALTSADFERIAAESGRKHSAVYIIQALRTELPYPIVFPSQEIKNNFTVYRMK